MREDIRVSTVIKIVILLLCMLVGMFFYKFYQPESKAIRLYEQGLKNYENGNYQNAYYLFSKIGYATKLKPIALYRQALCAKSLGDKVSEYKSYTRLFKYYPNNILSLDAKYSTAQILVDRNSELALKYFNQLLKSSIDEEHKTASKYYIAKIKSGKSIVSKKDIYGRDKEKIERYYRNYLKKYPNGRFASDAAHNWLEFNPNLSSKDLVLIARAFYYSKMYKEANDILEKTDIKDNWAIKSANYFALGNIEEGSILVYSGVSKFDTGIFAKDYKLAIDELLKYTPNPYDTISTLFKDAKGGNKEYLLYKKCDLSDSGDKPQCLKELYANYPDGLYAKYVLENLFDLALKNKDYKSVKQIEEDYIIRFPESEMVPKMMFWRAKAEQKYFYNPDFQIFYRNIVNNYPDTYYAYRSFWILQNFKSSVINTAITYKPIEYPYKYPSKNDIIYNLILVKDYDMIQRISEDGFIKSWALYKQGKYSESMHSAKSAMEKLKVKPPKHDVRWRLVYPLNYFKQVETNAASYNNNLSLILSILREESYFNSEAQSAVGAVGLMQLMPATAHDVGEKNGYSFDTRDLFNPELNIRLGNLYYASLREQLKNDNMLAIASYNGGIGSVMRWQKNINAYDFDEFVELIPYDETREYVKKILRSYWNYTRIYQE